MVGILSQTCAKACGDFERKADSLFLKRARRWVALFCVVLVGFALAGLPVYVKPQIDPLRKADAILILGGFGPDRYTFGLDLANEGWAPKVVVSRASLALPWRCEMQQEKKRMYCFTPSPNTTAGEAQEFRRLADQNHWRSVIVITFRPHISRARYILQQCFDGEITMVASPAQISPARWVYEYFYQTAGYIKAALQPAC